jgi:hypothetical protein
MPRCQDPAVTNGRQAYAHDAVLELDDGADDRAPGGAITVALCGRWEHEPPCPLAPHHTAVTRSGPEVALRVVFAAAPADEVRVRSLVEDALAHGEGWRLVRSTPSSVRPEEHDHAARLLAN